MEINFSALNNTEEKYKLCHSLLKVFAEMKNVPSTMTDLNVVFRKIVPYKQRSHDNNQSGSIPNDVTSGIRTYIQIWNNHYRLYNPNLTHPENYENCDNMKPHRVCSKKAANLKYRTKVYWIENSFAATVFINFSVNDAKRFNSVNTAKRFNVEKQVELKQQPHLYHQQRHQHDQQHQQYQHNQYHNYSTFFLDNPQYENQDQDTKSNQLLKICPDYNDFENNEKSNEKTETNETNDFSSIFFNNDQSLFENYNDILSKHFSTFLTNHDESTTFSFDETDLNNFSDDFLSLK